MAALSGSEERKGLHQKGARLGGRGSLQLAIGEPLAARPAFDGIVAARMDRHVERAASAAGAVEQESHVSADPLRDFELPESTAIHDDAKGPLACEWVRLHRGEDARAPNAGTVPLPEKFTRNPLLDSRMSLYDPVPSRGRRPPSSRLVKAPALEVPWPRVSWLGAKLRICSRSVAKRSA